MNTFRAELYIDEIEGDYRVTVFVIGLDGSLVFMEYHTFDSEHFAKQVFDKYSKEMKQFKRRH